MNTHSISDILSFHTLVVGSGAAGLRASECLYDLGCRDTALITVGVGLGTSFNTGSDKQTYYKLSLSGSERDSVREMAQTLFDGQAVDGDTALCEAASSAASFFHLTELGVPFPTNAYGEYVGYKTDHDPRRRATSAGPYTGCMMAKALEKTVRAKDIPIFERMQAIKLLVENERVAGLVCLDLDKLTDAERRYRVFRCANIIWATGGPADMYKCSVYPVSQSGATGVAFAAGAAGRNLTEWQFGLASLRPRWNVSGSYMQALPRVYSSDADGGDEREFLQDCFADRSEMLSMLFLKGYQWPFDARKAKVGSTRIDLMVYREQQRGRRVFLDYRNNPGKTEIWPETLSDEARHYLKSAGAFADTPIRRLSLLNQPAIDFYREHGIDLEKQPLEIALCVQHNNGGLAVDADWQTNIKGLYAAGEAAGTHGVYRPGGSALNAGQCGALRAALSIAALKTALPDEKSFSGTAAAALEALRRREREWQNGSADAESVYRQAQADMDAAAGPVRSERGLEKLLADTDARLRLTLRVSDVSGLSKAYALMQTLLCQKVYARAMLDYMRRGGVSRGSALYLDADDTASEGRYRLKDDTFGKTVQEIRLTGDTEEITWRNVRPIPSEDDSFEQVWRSYRQREMEIHKNAQNR
ncbi:MAG: FAD-binding protein [Clostridia bacterium]|nr:FAD-binding protein [Clostridia bacterium]